jgi:hypothetical protein
MALSALARLRGAASLISPHSWGAIALLCAVCVGFGSAAGWRVNQWRCDAARTQTAETAAADAREHSAAVIRNLLEQGLANDKVARAADRDTGIVHGHFVGLVRAVEQRRDVPAADPHAHGSEAGGDCPGAADDQWVHLWNAANAGPPGRGPPSAPSGVADDALRADPPAVDAAPAERR